MRLSAERRARAARATVVAATLAALFVGSPSARAQPEPGDDAVAAWTRAERAWARRSPDAYALWLTVPADSPEGVAARARLARAAELYAEGIAALARDDAEARTLFVRAQAHGPMDPALYLPLARACASTGLAEQADRYYARYLEQPSSPADRAIARRERAALAPALRDLFEPLPDAGVAFDPAPEPAPAPTAATPPAPHVPPDVVSAAPADAGSLRLVLVGLALGVSISGGAFLVRRRPPSLAELAERHPELHPAIAFLVSSLRHELLKHRIGASGDAILALGEGRASAADLAFVGERLYGGQPIRDAFRAHCASFERALGHGLDLRRDPRFRRAERAIRRIERLEPNVLARRPDALAALATEHAALRAFDAAIGRFASQLVRTRVDRDLLERVVTGVRGEYRTGAVALDELRLEAEEPADVEVFHADLELVLRNVVRNAILALADEPSPRRIAVLASVELEATGDETVRIRVLDSSSKPFDRSILSDRQIDRGLGLVTATVNRYGGTIDVERDATLGFAKAVVVSFFRVYRDHEEPRG